MEHIRVLGLSFLLVIGFGFVELFTGFYTKSLALVSDAGHMFTDGIALFIALVGIYISSKKGTQRMTYGLKRVEVLTGLINSLLLVLLIGYVFYEAIRRFFSPVEVLAGHMLAVASLGLFINLVMIFFLHGHTHDNLSIKTAFIHVIFDTVGSISTIFAGIFMLFTGYYVADSLVSLGLVLLIIPQVYNLLKLSIEILLQVAPVGIPLKELEEKVMALPYVKDVHDIHLWSLTSKDYILTMHLVVEDIRDYTNALRDVNEIAQGYGIKHSTLQIEEVGTYCISSKKCCLVH